MLPEAKLLIVNALKEKGEIVAMTGDGVNDGPALKASHIGIAMGERGTAIAKQAASLVIVNDDLSNMVTAVSFGRKIYSNLKKAIQYIISIHIQLISVVTIPLILGWKYLNIFSPIHVIFLELVMGPTCSIAFEYEPMEKDVMTQKPRKLSTTFFTWRELSVSMVPGLAITFGLMVVMYFSIDKGYTEPMTRTLVFSTLIFSNILLTLTSRSKTDSLITGLKTKNNLIPLMIGITLVILALALYFAPVRNLFQFVPINSIDIVYCSLVDFVSVIWVEIVKFILPDLFAGLPVEVEKLRQALASTDVVATRRAAHTVKGVAASANCESARKLALEMEVAARADDLTEVGRLLPALEGEVERFQQAASLWLEQRGV
jgi:Ca2+-transporting ATPase